ncbi:MAG: transposase [Trichocoleus desertorum ATA4-8-CV12]|jgi:putative transposase|nr:transposase [Trichocoleus desertorum ATA4-8-CV12]
MRIADEMTGIQALERKAATQSMRPGKRERREFEYIRHGTQTLIASFDVAQGRVVEATVGERRTETDYLNHIQQLIATDPNAVKWHLVMDCLNIHQSASLVRFVAQTEGLEIELGVKGESGIVKSMQTRSEFCATRATKSCSTSPPSIVLGLIRLRCGSAFWCVSCSNEQTLRVKGSSKTRF